MYKQVKIGTIDSLYCGNLIKAHRNERAGQEDTYTCQSYPWTLALEGWEGFSLSEDWTITAENRRYADGRPYAVHRIEAAVKAD